MLHVWMCVCEGEVFFLNPNFWTGIQSFQKCLFIEQAIFVKGSVVLWQFFIYASKVTIRPLLWDVNVRKLQHNEPHSTNCNGSENQHLHQDHIWGKTCCSYSSTHSIYIDPYATLCLWLCVWLPALSLTQRSSNNSPLSVLCLGLFRTFTISEGHLAKLKSQLCGDGEGTTETLGLKAKGNVEIIIYSRSLYSNCWCHGNTVYSRVFAWF